MRTTRRRAARERAPTGRAEPLRHVCSQPQRSVFSRRDRQRDSAAPREHFAALQVKGLCLSSLREIEPPYGQGEMPPRRKISTMIAVMRIFVATCTGEGPLTRTRQVGSVRAARTRPAAFAVHFRSQGAARRAARADVGPRARSTRWWWRTVCGGPARASSQASRADEQRGVRGLTACASLSLYQAVSSQWVSEFASLSGAQSAPFCKQLTKGIASWT